MGLEKIKDKELSNHSIKEKITWENFQKVISDEIDKDIVMYAKKSGKIYLGGKCCFYAEVEENEFSKTTILIIEAKLYFQKQFSKEAEIRTVTRKCNYNDFSDDTSTKNILRSIIDKQIEVEIEKPVI